MGSYVAEFNGDVLIAGGLYGLSNIVIPSATVVNSHVSATAAISASKLERSLRLVGGVTGQVADGTTVPLIFFCKGTTVTFKHMTCTQRVASAGSSSLTCDVLVDGVSILSSAVTLDSGDAAYSENEGTITDTSDVDGGCIRFEIVATQSGTDALAYGVFIQLDIDETYAN